MNATANKLLKATGTLATLGLLAALVLALAPTPLTQAHDVALIDRTIDVVMNEFSYTVDGAENGAITLKVGETVTLNFTNAGAIVHDAHFGTDPDLTGRLYNNNIVAPFDMLVLEPGERAQITFTPSEAGTFELGCFQPGHYEAGMKVSFVVE